VATLARRLRTRLRGMHWKQRLPREIPIADRRKIDAFHAVGVSLALIDPVRGSTFQSRAVAHALDAGDPLRLGPCLVMEAGYHSSVGAKGLARARVFVAEVGRIAESTRDPYVVAAHGMINGFLDFHAGAFARAARTLGAVENAFRTTPG